jgi:hypothetical protein
VAVIHMYAFMSVRKPPNICHPHSDQAASQECLPIIFREKESSEFCAYMRTHTDTHMQGIITSPKLYRNNDGFVIGPKSERANNATRPKNQQKKKRKRETRNNNNNKNNKINK